MGTRIAIVNLGMGNIHSVYKAFRLHQPFVTNNPKELSTADKIVLPGVGHFKKAMEALHANELLDELNKSVLIDKKPILGICLGMQLMSEKSEEGNAQGLGWFAGSNVVRFRPDPHLKIPHMGWNTLSKQKESDLFNNIPEQAEFYFAHSYYWNNTKSVETLSETDYILSFVSAIELDNIYGVQFHPEKSHEDGLKLIQNFSLM